MVNGAVPVFLRVTTFVGLVVASAWAAKVRLVGVKDTPGGKESLVMNASEFPVLQLPQVVSNAPAVVGKFVEAVPPATYSAPGEPKARLVPPSRADPPR